jgi:hypothetical protein
MRTFENSGKNRKSNEHEKSSYNNYPNWIMGMYGGYPIRNITNQGNNI